MPLLTNFLVWPGLVLLGVASLLALLLVIRGREPRAYFLFGGFAFMAIKHVGELLMPISNDDPTIAAISTAHAAALIFRWIELLAYLLLTVYSAVRLRDLRAKPSHATNVA